MSPAYQAINLPHDIPDLSKPFALTTGPGTDVWDKPPSTHSFNAPIVYQTTTVGQFKRARVTVSADWKDKYDQGGLVLVISPESESRQWVKSGIEQEQGRPNLGTVATVSHRSHGRLDIGQIFCQVFRRIPTDRGFSMSSQNGATGPCYRSLVQRLPLKSKSPRMGVYGYIKSTAVLR